MQLAQRLNQPVESDGVVSHAQGDLPIQQDQRVKRAPPRCSGCGGIGIELINVKIASLRSFDILLVEIS